MPVSVSLFHFVQAPDTRSLWPEQFRGLLEACEKDVPDRLPFGVMADWCDEQGEPELGEAFRWLHKRPEVVIESDRRLKSQTHWLTHHPTVMGSVGGGSVNLNGLIGVVIALAKRIAEMREAIA